MLRRRPRGRLRMTRGRCGSLVLQRMKLSFTTPRRFDRRTRSKDMFTRVVELTSKSGKSKELASAINEKAVPILKKQPGFVDETILVSDTEPTRVLGLSF